MRRTISINNFIIQFFSLFILVLLLLFTFQTWNDSIKYESWYDTIALLSIIFLIYQLMIFLEFNTSYSDFRLWFIILCHIFMFGRVYLRALHLDTDIFWDIMSRFSSRTLYHTGLFVLCCIQALFIGFTIRGKNISSKLKRWKYLNGLSEESISELMLRSGILLFIFSFPFRLIEDIRFIMQVQPTGNYSSFSSRSGISDDVAFLFLPSVLYIIASKGISKKKTIFIVFGTVIYYVFVMVSTGDRRYPVTAVIALVLCYLQVYKVKMNLLRFFVTLFICNLSLNFLAVLRIVRHGNLTGVMSFFIEYRDALLSNNAVYETLSEFGLSFLSTVSVIEHIPTSIDFQNGLGFYGAIPTILPVGRMFPDFFSQVSISRRINMITGYSLGSTIFGDFFANFGWVSVLLIIFYGAILSGMFYVDIDKMRNLSLAKYYSLFYILINLVRASFYETFRASMSVWLVPLIILYFIKPVFRKKKLT